MLQVAKGTFQVEMKPQPVASEDSDTNKLGRMALSKVFEGDLKAEGKGEMLTAMTQTTGSAGYVAMERVTGELKGRKGSFVFQHTGSMNRGAQQLSISVVADSGTGDLAGLSGAFGISITDGQHLYEFSYTLP